MLYVSIVSSQEEMMWVYNVSDISLFLKIVDGVLEVKLMVAKPV